MPDFPLKEGHFRSRGTNTSLTATGGLTGLVGGSGGGSLGGSAGGVLDAAFHYQLLVA